ncbi:DUF2971 domain-containing protein [Pantoea agglomerans]|uniref:DUF2971 domain-containing protein n=1 Tax=Enterobacter agglomerans TaxID=549 RepID=UPI0028992B73|nr:DUF2971 domain-containing protein [Pantoea agglomerans]WNK38472.1 DUF2971 domain-containing protein [Pantoea agglomerans]
MTNLYKFMGADVADKLMMDEKNIGIKFSPLEQYNDPYEFFLTIDFNRTSAELAFYNEMIGMVTKQPATCFTKSPVIPPMWAHYGGNSSGFVIEINEEKFERYIKDIGFDEYTSIADVEYRDLPDDAIEDTLARAFHIGKPRYVYWLQSYIRHAAYLTKQTCWSYEQERRVIVEESALTKINDWLMLLPVPINCITAIIVGHKSDEQLKQKIRNLAKKAKCGYFEMVIGKITTTPFLLSKNLKSHQFIGGRIEPVSYQCKQCHEPLITESKLCGWCGITDRDVEMAERKNSLRMIAHYGGLENYVASMRAIADRFNNR